MALKTFLISLFLSITWIILTSIFVLVLVIHFIFKVNFEEINNRNLAQQREQEQREARRESQRKERLVKITAELSGD